MDEEARRWIKENLPSGKAIVRVDADAVHRWIERNPDATVEDLIDLVRAPDHVIEIIKREDEEDWEWKGD